MADENFITVNIHVGRAIRPIKMEKGTSFENKGGIFTAEKDGQTLKINTYQMQVIQAVANNYDENNNKEITLSKKDIDMSIQKYEKGTLGKDLGEFLGGLYKVKNPKAFKEEHKISAYITNNKPSTSSILCFKYESNTIGPNTETKVDSTSNVLQNSFQSKTFSNPNIIEIKSFKYTLKKGENITKIAKKYELDTYQIIAANPQLKLGRDYKIHYRKNNTAVLESYLKEGDSIVIPPRYSIKENSVKNLSDLCKITGLSEGYIKDLLTIIEVNPKHPGKPDLTTYNDGYGMPTIGYGHTGMVDGKELSLKKKITITESKALQLLADDLIKHEAMVIAYLGKENYEKAPASVRSAIVDIAYNKGIWDGFLNPNHNSSTSKIKSDLQNRDYASALCHTKRMNTPNRGLKRRNIYRFISGLADLSPSKRDDAIKEMNAYYKTVLKSLNDTEKKYMQSAWNNAKHGKVTGYRIQTAQKSNK